MYYMADEMESNTTSTTMQLKLNFTFPTVSDDADFIISWTAEIHANSSASYINVCLMCDGMALNEQDWHPNPDGGTEEGWAVASGWKYADLNAGPHEFTIWFKSSTAGEMVKIRRARILAQPSNAIIVLN